MNLQEIKYNRIESRAQAILFDKSGMVLDSDDALFPVERNKSNVFQDTYFFAGMDESLENLSSGDELTFHCIGLSLYGYESYFDFVLKKVEDKSVESFCWLIFDFGDQYRRVIDIQQERNMQAIASRKLERKNKEIKEEKQAIERLYKELNSSEGSEYVLIKSNNLLVNVDTGDILFFEAFGDYVKVHTETKVYVVHTRMKELEDSLPSKRFFRVHRSYLVQTSKIKNIEQLSLAIGEKIIPIGKNNKQGLLEQMGQL